MQPLQPRKLTIDDICNRLDAIRFAVWLVGCYVLFGVLVLAMMFKMLHTALTTFGYPGLLWDLTQNMFP